MKTTTTLLFTILISLSIFGQSSAFEEGVITYEINFDDANLPKEAKMMFDGAQSTTYIKGDKFRMDMNMAMQSTTTIVDSKNNTTTTLMDIMGMKYMIKSSAEEVEKEVNEMPDVDIKYTDESKVIAGYNCKKAEVTVKNKSGNEKVDVFITEEIPYSNVKNVFKGLKGFPLEYSLNTGGMKMGFKVIKISKEKISDSKFELPKDGYTEMKMEDFKKQMMKMGG